MEVWHFYVNTAVSTEQNVNRKPPTVNLFSTVSKSELNSFCSYSSSGGRNPPQFNNGMTVENGRRGSLVARGRAVLMPGVQLKVQVFMCIGHKGLFLLVKQI